MKFELNLFENTVANLKDYQKVPGWLIDVAYNAAAESITLLK
jgi:beta-glucosidase